MEEQNICQRCTLYKQVRKIYAEFTHHPNKQMKWDFVEKLVVGLEVTAQMWNMWKRSKMSLVTCLMFSIGLLHHWIQTKFICIGLFQLDEQTNYMNMYFQFPQCKVLTSLV